MNKFIGINQGNNESAQKTEYLHKETKNDFINTQYFKLTTAANTLWFPNNSEKNIKLNQSLIKFKIPNWFYNKHLNTLGNQSWLKSTILPKLSCKISDKSESRISYTNLLSELNVAFDFINLSKYQSLRYDVNKIFFNDKKYFEMIRGKIDEMKNSSKFEIEEKGFIVKKYYEKNKQIEMILNSITIEFIFPTMSFKDPIIHHLPLCLLPLFYYNDPQDIKYLFMSLINFSEDFEEINLDYQKMYNFFIFSDKYDTAKKNNINYSKEKFNLHVYMFKWYTPKYEMDVKIR